MGKKLKVRENHTRALSKDRINRSHHKSTLLLIYSILHINMYILKCYYK